MSRFGAFTDARWETGANGLRRKQLDTWRLTGIEMSTSAGGAILFDQRAALPIVGPPPLR